MAASCGKLTPAVCKVKACEVLSLSELESTLKVTPNKVKPWSKKAKDCAMVIWPLALARPKVLRLRANSGVTAKALSEADRVTAATPPF